MRTLRNASFIKQAALMLFSSALLAAIAATTASTTCGLWAFASGCAALALFTVFSELRYREIAQLAEEIDEILHEGRRIDFSDYKEGDVSILKNQLSKMVATLKDTSMRLEKEKNALASALADISHQIRTPLTAASLMIHSIETSTDQNERARALRNLENMVNRIGWLVTALLKLAKVDAGAFRVQNDVVNAARVARDACAPLAISMDLHNIDCIIEANNDATFFGDGAWSTEALGNILKNCLEHTPDSGCIRINVSENALACRIRITDTGPGIAPEDLPHIFERFYRGRYEYSAQTGQSAAANAPKKDQGFGIGLALAHSLVAAQGGTLHASNAHKGGAQFDIVFPKLVV